MDCHTIEELKTYFEVKLASLTTCMDVVFTVSESDGVGSECREQLALMKRDLWDAESAVAQIREWVKGQRRQLESAKTLQEQLKELNAQLHHMESHLPDRLPSRHKPAQHHPSGGSQCPLQSKPVMANENARTGGGSAPADKPYKPPPAPVMDYVTVQEFGHVPKYMKGRMTYDSLNTTVEAFNAALESKYRLMKRPRSGLNDADRKQYYKYKEEENKDTKGLYFVTEQDLKRLGRLKMDASARSSLTVLRHCCRLRELRGGGITRYVVTP